MSAYVRLNDFLIYPTTLKMWDVTKVPHLVETRVITWVLPKLSEEINVRVETTSLSNQIQETHGCDPIIRTYITIFPICFICKGPYLARECSNWTAFNAFQASLTSDSYDKSSHVEGEVVQIEEEITLEWRPWNSYRLSRRRWGRQVGR